MVVDDADSFVVVLCQLKSNSVKKIKMKDVVRGHSRTRREALPVYGTLLHFCVTFSSDNFRLILNAARQREPGMRGES
eukprot:8477409-Heterocapsa_arctica.AAC.1